MSDTQATADNAAPAATEKKGGFMGKLLIAAFMGGVVLVECLLAYFLFPSTEEVAALAQKNLEKTLPASLAAEQVNAASSENDPVAEVDLGEYSITVSQPNSATSLRVDFHLFGTVLESDTSKFKTLFDRNIHRFRDQVLYEIRNSEPVDLADPGLALIKRRILEKSNALFGEPILRGVMFSEFSYIEQ